MSSTSAAVTFLVVGVVLCVVEVFAPGLVILPFGIGALVASFAGFLGASPVVSAVVFLVVSVVAFGALRPLATRLNKVGGESGVGAGRLLGAHAVVLEHIAPGDTGLVRVDREEWRAESSSGFVLDPGTSVTVVDVRGTRVLVEPTGPQPGGPAAAPPAGPPIAPPPAQ